MLAHTDPAAALQDVIDRLKVSSAAGRQPLQTIVTDLYNTVTVLTNAVIVLNNQVQTDRELLAKLGGALIN